jgi:hypothetical protein
MDAVDALVSVIVEETRQRFATIRAALDRHRDVRNRRRRHKHAEPSALVWHARDFERSRFSGERRRRRIASISQAVP